MKIEANSTLQGDVIISDIEDDNAPLVKVTFHNEVMANLSNVSKFDIAVEIMHILKEKLGYEIDNEVPF